MPKGYSPGAVTENCIFKRLKSHHSKSRLQLQLYEDDCCQALYLSDYY